MRGVPDSRGEQKGIGEVQVMCLIPCSPFAPQLAVRRETRLPSGFGLWGAFDGSALSSASQPAARPRARGLSGRAAARSAAQPLLSHIVDGRYGITCYRRTARSARPCSSLHVSLALY